jgi:hypothetical protein
MGQAETGRSFVPCQAVSSFPDYGDMRLMVRNKEPEYALYMLNRATIKNVLWPLIPNEMRVTPTVDDMLIVERRGEGMSQYWIRT